ncbi:DUF607-domain-containing protein [Basidiobolus meristosporus CBS 931.73]|uniref:Calcium uniporter protein, mitochondrial n=1 Tax=Basidiobolus meristosporus CBS 931.73 TaxID=1314790 RepID=A0A1Y1YMB1_9FUNG|nr:DUF607-domain-containing protein [Basidiobolus meristosporus CBS 931.73]|eukprot:ORX98983.1 DUF607-domain-containing protein [Basidiobolus meristosporus CBS 931.73]
MLALQRCFINKPSIRISYPLGFKISFGTGHVHRFLPCQHLSHTSYAENATSVDEKLGDFRPVYLNRNQQPPSIDLPTEIQSFGQGEISFNMDDENPILIVNRVFSEVAGAAFPVSLNSSLSMLAYQIKEEYPQLTDVAFYEIGPDFRPSIKYSRHFRLKDLIRSAMHNPHKGFFISLNSSTLFVGIPTFQGSTFTVPSLAFTLTLILISERTHKLIHHISSIDKRLEPLSRLKETCDTLAEKTNKNLIRGGMLGLCSYFGFMAKLTWWDYGWDVMEPFSYFTGVGVGIFGYLYFLITKKDYSYTSITKHAADRRQMALYTEHGLDLNEYQALRTQRDEISARIESIKREYESYYR